MSIQYKEKYLKYKEKYLKLKNLINQQNGGAILSIVHNNGTKENVLIADNILRMLPSMQIGTIVNFGYNQTITKENYTQFSVSLDGQKHTQLYEFKLKSPTTPVQMDNTNYNISMQIYKTENGSFGLWKKFYINKINADKLEKSKLNVPFKIDISNGTSTESRIETIIVEKTSSEKFHNQVGFVIKSSSQWSKLFPELKDKTGYYYLNAPQFE